MQLPCKSKSAPKRLCGKLGGGSIPPPPIDAAIYDTPPTTEWTFVCSQGGKTKYPYGDDYKQTNCQPANGTPPTASYLPAQAATQASCHGTTAPYDKVVGMEGFAEWLDGCGETQFLCHTRGSGSNGDPDSDLCGRVFVNTQGVQDWHSVRCCTD